MRTHYCGFVDENLTGQEVTVAGWVHRRRDHGGVIFVDMRDREGLLQVVFDPDAAAMFKEAERLRSEFVVRVKGLVRARPGSTANSNLRSGKVELLARELEVLKVTLPNPVPRISYSEAMRRYGSDKPDLRIALELVDVADLVKDCEFKVFAGPAKDPKGRVTALRVPGGNAMSRSQIDDYTAYVARYGAKGLAYIKVTEVAKGRDGLQSPITKFLSDDAVKGILSRTGAVDGDLIFFGADKAKVVSDALGALRLRVGHDLKLVANEWKPLWVTDFPMFEYDPEAKRWAAMHHPFTAPVNDDPAALKADPESALSKGYDMVLNGSEIGGGSVRIHRQEMQSTVFELLGIDAAEATLKFGFLLDALKFGAPPHGGIAFGLDRLCMLMAGADSIREVIAFPKTQTAADPLTDAPTVVSEAQLRELHIRVRQQTPPA